MREAADGEQRDERAAVRDRIDADRSDGDDAVQDLERDACSLCHGAPLIAEHRKSDGQTARSRTRDAGHDVRRDDGREQRAERIRNTDECLRDRHEARQARNNAAESIARSDIQDGRRRGDGCIVDRCQETIHDHETLAADERGCKTAENQRDRDGPDSRYFADIRRQQAELERQERRKCFRIPMEAPFPLERIREDDVDYDDHDERQQGPVPRDVDFRARLVVRAALEVTAIALAACLEDLRTARHPAPADQQEQEGGEETDDRSRPRARREVRGRDDVLDLRRARQSDHREGEDTNPERRRQQALRDVCLAEDNCAERIHDKGDDEDGKTAIRQSAAAQQDRQHSAFLAEHLDDLRCDRRRKPAFLHQARKDGAEQENRIIRLRIFSHACHIELTVRRQDTEDTRKRCDTCKNWCDQDDRPAAVSKIHETDEGHRNTDSF